MCNFFCLKFQKKIKYSSWLSFIHNFAIIQQKQTFVLYSQQMEEAIVHVKQTYSTSAQTIPVKNLFLLKYGRLPQIVRLTPVSKDNESNVKFHVKSVLNRINILSMNNYYHY